jgi:hypothetical protein
MTTTKHKDKTVAGIDDISDLEEPTPNKDEDWNTNYSSEVPAQKRNSQYKK